MGERVQESNQIKWRQNLLLQLNRLAHLFYQNSPGVQLQRLIMTFIQIGTVWKRSSSSSAGEFCNFFAGGTSWKRPIKDFIYSQNHVSSSYFTLFLDSKHDVQIRHLHKLCSPTPYQHPPSMFLKTCLNYSLFSSETQSYWVKWHIL